MDNDTPVLGAVLLMLFMVGVVWLLAWAFDFKGPIIPASQDQTPIEQQQLPWWMVD